MVLDAKLASLLDQLNRSEQTRNTRKIADSLSILRTVHKLLFTWFMYKIILMLAILKIQKATPTHYLAR